MGGRGASSASGGVAVQKKLSRMTNDELAVVYRTTRETWEEAHNELERIQDRSNILKNVDSGTMGKAIAKADSQDKKLQEILDEASSRKREYGKKYTELDSAREKLLDEINSKSANGAYDRVDGVSLEHQQLYANMTKMQRLNTEQLPLVHIPNSLRGVPYVSSYTKKHKLEREAILNSPVHVTTTWKRADRQETRNLEKFRLT